MAKSIGRKLMGRLFVVQTGLATTALALLAVYLIDKYTQLHVMGLYYHYIIPFGAIGVGLVAAIGYAIASWYSGLKVSRLLLAAVVLLQVLAYFAAQYIEFRSLHLYYWTGEPVSFFTYFHIMTTTTHWDDNTGFATQPFGILGYGLRLLEIAGFAASGLAAPASLMGSSYCETCQRYRKRRDFGAVPVAEAVPVPSPDAHAALEDDIDDPDEQDRWMLGAQAAFTQLREIASIGGADAFRATLQPLAAERKQIVQLPCHMILSLAYCPECMDGTLSALVVRKQGSTRQVDLLPAEKVPPEFVAGIEG